MFIPHLSEQITQPNRTKLNKLQDMLLAASAARSSGTPIPIGESAANLYTEMIDADTSSSNSASQRDGGDSVKEAIAQGHDVGHAQQEKKELPARGDRDFSVIYDYLRELAEESRSRARRT